MRTESRAYSYAQVSSIADEIGQQLGDDRGLVFVAGSNSVYTLAGYVAALRNGHVTHILDPEKVDENQQLVATYEPDAIVTCDDEGWVVARSSSSTRPHPDIALLLATSGSTGSSKFVKLSYENLSANTASIVSYLGLQGSDRAITLLKPFYSYGLSVINTHLAVGGSLILTNRSIQEPELWQLAEDHGATNFSGVPHTFQMLNTMSRDWNRLPRLRFVTQAGGRLDAHLVRRFARIGRDSGWDFFVMYGQTEGSPRLAYLPPHLAEIHPDSIGVPVPGGSIELVDENAEVIDDLHVEGELVYRGPNVMIGYAFSREDLAGREEIECLRTGDVAERIEGGLYKITGRLSRFVKPLGVRVSLDDIEQRVSEWYGACAVTGTDDVLRVVLEGDGADVDLVKKRLEARYRLPTSFFDVQCIPEIPHLASGKVDYRSLSTAYFDDTDEDSRSQGEASFIRRFLSEFKSLLIGESEQVMSVEDAFRKSFGVASVSAGDSFVRLAGDSLSYVRTATYLEEYLDELPEGWHEMTVEELEAGRRDGINV